MKVVHSSDERELKLNVDLTTVTTVTNTTVDKVCDEFRHDF